MQAAASAASSGGRELERTGRGDQPLFGGEPVEELAGPRGRRGRARSGARGAGSPRRRPRRGPTAAASSRTSRVEVARAPASYERAQERRDLGASRALAHRPEREDERDGPENARHSAARSSTTWPFSRVFSAGSPMMSRASASSAARPRRTPAPAPYTRLRRIRVSAAEVRDAGSSATERIFSRETSDTSRTERTSEEAAMPSAGHDRSPGIRWYSIEGISPTSASPDASFAAQTDGRSRETSTPGGGSWSRPQVRGRAFRKSTTEMRSKLSAISSSLSAILGP